MRTRGRITSTVGGGVLALLVACGGQGLPPAGPAPGEVDVGYGARPGEKVTGAVTSTTGDKVAASAPLRLEQLLRGKSAGLQIITKPDGTQALRIRGGTVSLLGQNEQEPLVVVDGIRITQNDLASALMGLTPEDIRQVDVLKDVASTSIYGMAGAAGVIVIATRRR